MLNFNLHSHNPCTHNVDNLSVVRFIIWSQELGKCTHPRNCCPLTRCTLSSKAFHIQIFSIWLLNSYQPIFPTNNNRRVPLKFLFFCKKARKCIWIFNGEVYRCSNSFHSIYIGKIKNIIIFGKILSNYVYPTFSFVGSILYIFHFVLHLD